MLIQVSLVYLPLSFSLKKKNHALLSLPYLIIITLLPNRSRLLHTETHSRITMNHYESLRITTNHNESQRNTTNHYYTFISCSLPHHSSSLPPTQVWISWCGTTLSWKWTSVIACPGDCLITTIKNKLASFGDVLPSESKSFLLVDWVFFSSVWSLYFYSFFFFLMVYVFFML